MRELVHAGAWPIVHRRQGCSAPAADPALPADGKIIAWEFTDYSFPWTVSSITTLLASQQVGIKSKSPGSGNGNQGGGEIYAFENSKVLAEEIPWLQPDPFPLRTSNLRAPGQL